MRMRRISERGWLRAIQLVAALACLMAIAGAAPRACAVEPATGLKGRLYVGVWKRLPPASNGPAQELVVIDLATGGFQEILAECSGPRVSPDGKELAYVKVPEGIAGRSAGEVFRRSVDFSNEPQYLWGTARVVGWANEGKTLFLSATEQVEGNRGRWNYTNWRINADGSESEKLDLPKTVLAVDCSADAKELLVYGVIRAALHVKSLETGKTSQLSAPGDRTYAGRFSPDGKQVAYVASGKPDRVVIIDSDGKNPRTVYEAEGFVSPEEVCWSPDGKHLALVAMDWIERGGQRIRSIADGDDNNWRILILDVDGGEPQTIHLQGLSLHQIDSPDWGP